MAVTARRGSLQVRSRSMLWELISIIGVIIESSLLRALRYMLLTPSRAWKSRLDCVYLGRRVFKIGRNWPAVRELPS